MTELIHKWGPTYLLVQGVGGLAWWVGLLGSERVQGWFVPQGWEAARTLMVADIVLFGGGSLAAGFSLAKGSRWAGPALWALTGVVAYATLVAVGWLFEPISHWLGLAFMVPSLVLTAAIAIVDASESSR